MKPGLPQGSSGKGPVGLRVRGTPLSSADKEAPKTETVRAEPLESSSAALLRPCQSPFAGQPGPVPLWAAGGSALNWDSEAETRPGF